MEAVLGPDFSIRKKNFIYTQECSEHDYFLGAASIDQQERLYNPFH